MKQTRLLPSLVRGGGTQRQSAVVGPPSGRPSGLSGCGVPHSDPAVTGCTETEKHPPVTCVLKQMNILL